MSWPDDLRAAECDGAEFAHLAMPLGGIGTGNLAICADGGLRQWQLHNLGNHAGALPGSFFALRVSRWEPPLDEVRILQAPPRDSTGTPLVTDDVVPQWQRDLLSRYPGVARTTFCGTYPIARPLLTPLRGLHRRRAGHVGGSIGTPPTSRSSALGSGGPGADGRSR